MFTLFYALHTCSLATIIALEEVGVDYELRHVDFRKSEQQSPE